MKTDNKVSPPKKGRGPLRVDYVPIAKVKPSEKNSRKHDPNQIDKIVASIEAVGWTKPIIVDEDYEILAGHGAYQAAQQLGMAEVPVILRAGLTAAQRRAYRIADNKIAEQSQWDNSVLASEFAELTRMGFDMSLTGFNPSEIEFMLAPPPQLPPEPPAAKIQKRVVTKLGDVWQLGEHRIICGDSTLPATYKELMQGRKAQCVFTDPPYGVSYRARADIGSRQFAVLENDDKRRGQLKAMLHGAFGCAAKHTRDDAGWYVWHGDNTRREFQLALAESGLIEKGVIIWVKGLVLGANDYQSAHEPCFYAAKQECRPAFHGDRTQASVWRLESRALTGEPNAIGTGLIISGKDGCELFLSEKPPKGKKLRHLHADPDKPLFLQSATDQADVWEVTRDTGTGDKASIHPTQKPVELARRACRNSALEGEIVLDMFAGSGSTLMAAEQTKRIGYAIELDPHYVDAIVRRWQDMTGKQATHGNEKKTFEAVAKARGKA